MAGGFQHDLRAVKSFTLVLLTALSLGTAALAAGPDAAEMQARGRSILLTRAVPAAEAMLRSQAANTDQAQAINLLLQEERSMMLVFIHYSPLTGEALQAKLQEVMDVTAEQVRLLTQPAPGQAADPAP